LPCVCILSEIKSLVQNVLNNYKATCQVFGPQLNEKHVVVQEIFMMRLLLHVLNSLY
jgi:hypothetical protein